MIYKTFDIVVVPFPFTDHFASKNRPALVLSSAESFNSQIGHSVLAMITSARNERWPLDILISNLATTGLSKASIIRMKLFTLDNRLIHQTIGTLSEHDKKTVVHSLSLLLGDAFPSL